MKNNKNFSTINGIVFGVVFVLILIEAVFNIFGLWTAWNLFGFLIKKRDYFGFIDVKSEREGHI